MLFNCEYLTRITHLGTAVPLPLHASSSFLLCSTWSHSKPRDFFANFTTRNAACLVPAALLQSRNWSNSRMRISRARWCYAEGLGEDFPTPALPKRAEQGWLFPNSCSDRLLQESCRGWAALWQPAPGLSWGVFALHGGQRDVKHA